MKAFCQYTFERRRTHPDSAEAARNYCSHNRFKKMHPERNPNQNEAAREMMDLGKLLLLVLFPTRA